MKCTICNSEEHFRAKCPQNRGRGAGGGAQASFSGLTYGAYPAFNESHRAEVEDDTPPWGNLDSDQFVTSADVFATNFEAVDPLQTTDPWALTIQRNTPPPAEWAALWTWPANSNVEDRQQQAHLFNHKRIGSLHFNNPLDRQPLSHHRPNLHELQDYCEG